MSSPIIDPDAKPDFSALTIEELKAESLRLAGVLDLVNAQRREIQKIVELRLAEVAAQQRVSTLSATQKDALRAIL